MITSNALRRTFHLKHGNQAGTCFAIDVEDKQYLVTAAHLLAPNKEQNPQPLIMHDKQWKAVPCSFLGCAPNSIDIAVFALENRVADSDLKLIPTSLNTYLSQDIYFLGFPYGLRCDLGAANADFPIPLVRKGCLAKIATPDQDFMILDARNNPGFSGGPVIFLTEGKIGVAGVISGMRWAQQEINLPAQPNSVKVWTDAGLVTAYAIEHALNLIKSSEHGTPSTS
jgi:S1-C subfamily serine protease